MTAFATNGRPLRRLNLNMIGDHKTALERGESLYLSDHGFEPDLGESVRNVSEDVARIQQWCEWFDLAMPSLKIVKGQVHLTEQLQTWMNEAYASWEWIFRGDAKVMAGHYRKAVEGERAFASDVQAMDPVEQKLMLFAMRSSLDDSLNFDDIMAAFKAAIAEHRAGKVQP